MKLSIGSSIILLLCGFAVPSTARAADVNCKTLERFMLGKDGKRSRYFQKDGGVVDVVVYLSGSDGDDRILRVPATCVVFQSRFHASLMSLRPGASGMTVHIRDEARQYRVTVQLSELRPRKSEVSTIPFAATDVDRVEKREVPDGLFVQ